MLERTFCKSILSFSYLIDADATYFLAVVSSIDCHRGLEQTQQQSSVYVLPFGMSLVYHAGPRVVLLCQGTVSWQTTCILCFITRQLQGHYTSLFLWNRRLIFPCVQESGSFRYWLMSNEMAFSYYRMKILIWEMLSEKKGTFIMLPVCAIIS